LRPSAVVVTSESETSTEEEESRDPESADDKKWKYGVKLIKAKQ
jgi:hypothetical protein